MTKDLKSKNECARMGGVNMCVHSNIMKEKQGQLVFCNRCGHIIYEYVNGKSNRTGCKNTRCINHLPQSQNLSREEIRAVRR